MDDVDNLHDSAMSDTDYDSTFPINMDNGEPLSVKPEQAFECAWILDGQGG